MRYSVVVASTAFSAESDGWVSGSGARMALDFSCSKYDRDPTVTDGADEVANGVTLLSLVALSEINWPIPVPSWPYAGSGVDSLASDGVAPLESVSSVNDVLRDPFNTVGVPVWFSDAFIDTSSSKWLFICCVRIKSEKINLENDRAWDIRNGLTPRASHHCKMSATQILEIEHEPIESLWRSGLRISAHSFTNFANTETISSYLVHYAFTRNRIKIYGDIRIQKMNEI